MWGTHVPQSIFSKPHLVICNHATPEMMDWMFAKGVVTLLALPWQSQGGGKRDIGEIKGTRDS